MTIIRIFALSWAAFIVASIGPACAQEVVVSGAWRAGAPPPNPNAVPVTQLPSVIGLRRPADFVIQAVRVVGDTRDETTRRRELCATVLTTIRAARQAGIDVASGQDLLEPLTEATHCLLPMSGAGRPDTDQVTFLLKVPVIPGVTLVSAAERIAAFVKQVLPSGRTSIEISGGPALSVVNPDQYRGQIIDLIAADAAATRARFGPGNGVQVTGLDRAVQWRRTGPTEVMLYLPGGYTIVPAQP